MVGRKASSDSARELSSVPPSFSFLDAPLGVLSNELDVADRPVVCIAPEDSVKTRGLKQHDDESIYVDQIWRDVGQAVYSAVIGFLAY
jgi:hypothetical protein